MTIFKSRCKEVELGFVASQAALLQRLLQDVNECKCAFLWRSYPIKKIALRQQQQCMVTLHVQACFPREICNSRRQTSLSLRSERFTSKSAQLASAAFIAPELKYLGNSVRRKVVAGELGFHRKDIHGVIDHECEPCLLDRCLHYQHHCRAGLQVGSA